MKRTLYIDRDFLSPYAMSAYVALRAKQLDFELELVDIHTGEQFRDSYASVSATSRVPTLVEDDFSVSESTAIAEYVEDVHPGVHLYPTDSRQRARIRQIQAWLRSDLQSLRTERTTAVVFEAERFPPLSPAGMGDAGKLIRAAEQWLSHGRPHLVGQWSLADTDLALMLQRLICHEEFVPTHLRQYAQAQWKHPAIQDWVSAGKRARA